MTIRHRRSLPTILGSSTNEQQEKKEKIGRKESRGLSKQWSLHVTKRQSITCRAHHTIWVDAVSEKRIQDLKNVRCRSYSSGQRFRRSKCRTKN